MQHEYIKYRQFLRSFSDFSEKADEDTVYEIVGRGGVTVGYFSKKDPR